MSSSFFIGGGSLGPTANSVIGILALSSIANLSFAQNISACTTETKNYRNGAKVVTTCDALQLLNDNPITPNGIIPIKHQGTSIPVKVEHLRNLQIAHDRIGKVAKINAKLKIEADNGLNASANFSTGTISITTGLLGAAASDQSMLAAVIGHEFAHLQLRHDVQSTINSVNSLRTAVVTERLSRGQPRAYNNPVQVVAKDFSRRYLSFSREQELEADKVGTELMSDANYDPQGALRLMSLFLEKHGPTDESAAYRSTHPGAEERILRSGPVIANQQYNLLAKELVEKKDWGRLSTLVTKWRTSDSGSGRAWYYQGILSKATKKGDALEAFKKSVDYDPNFVLARFSLCTEHYQRGNYRESLVCSEFIPRGGLLTEFENATFKHQIYVSGVNGVGQQFTAEDVLIAQALCRRGMC